MESENKKWAEELLGEDSDYEESMTRIEQIITEAITKKKGPITTNFIRAINIRINALNRKASSTKENHLESTSELPNDKRRINSINSTNSNTSERKRNISCTKESSHGMSSSEINSTNAKKRKFDHQSTNLSEETKISKYLNDTPNTTVNHEVTESFEKCLNVEVNSNNSKQSTTKKRKILKDVTDKDMKDIKKKKK